MFALVRQLREGPGVCEYADTELTGDVITIGSAPDRDIQLLGRGVAADHAVIRRSGGTLGIVARGGTLLQINGIARSAAPLSSGDTIDIGGNIITMLPPPAGFDLALAVQPNADVKGSAAKTLKAGELWWSDGASAVINTGTGPARLVMLEF